MQRLRTVLPAPRWWFVGSLGGLGVLLVACVVLSLFQYPSATTQRQATLPLAVTAPAPVLSWTYTAAAPERFVVRRSLDGGTWQDVAVVPGATGTGLTWEDTTLPAGATPVVAQYVVYAVVGKEWSETSNRAIATFGGASRRASDTVTIVRADSAETQAGKHQARLAGDAKSDTFWHTKWSGTPAPLPHWIVLDLGAVTPVDGLAYLPRQDGSAQGRIAEYAVAVSLDNTAWSEPVAQGTWVWGPTALEQYVRWPVVEARYVRLTSLSEASGGPWTAAAEIGLYAGEAPPPQPPAGVSLGECVVTRPEEKVTVMTCRQP